MAGDTYLSGGLDDVFVPHPVAGAVWRIQDKNTGEAQSSGVLLHVLLVTHREGARVPGLPGVLVDLPEDRRVGWDVLPAGCRDHEYWPRVDGTRALLPITSALHLRGRDYNLALTWSNA